MLMTGAQQMKDLAEVSKEVVATSFSSSNFAKAVDCWQVLREQALLVSGHIMFPVRKA
jgi:hypothetical protein